MHVFRDLPSVLISTFVAVVPVFVMNPGFASTVLDWGELIILLAGLSIVVAVLDFLLSSHSWFAHRTYLRLSLLAVLLICGLVGWIVVGLAAAIVASGLMLTLVVMSRRFPSRGNGLSARSAGVVLGAIAGSCVLSLWTWGLSRPSAPNHQLIVIGFDGATWKTVDRLIEDGRLPEFESMIGNGVRAELDTLTPVLSPPIWTTIASGHRPEIHGVRDFWANSNTVRVKRIWEIVDAVGRESGVLGYLVTWPPQKTSGFLVPGWLAGSADTFPSSLRFLKELERRAKGGDVGPSWEMVLNGLYAIKNGVTLSTINYLVGALWETRSGEYASRKRALMLRLGQMRMKTDVFCHLIKRLQPDLGVVYFNATDAVQHLFFKYFEPEGFPNLTRRDVRELGDAIPQAYEEADRSLARISRAVSPNASIIVVSDHGQKSARSDGPSWFEIRVQKTMSTLRLRSDFRASKVGRSVWLRRTSDAWSMEDLANLVETIRVVEDDKPLFRLWLHDRDQARLRVREDYDPAIHSKVRIEERIYQATDFVAVPDKITGAHTDTALLLMSGPDIRKGAQIERSSVLDITPTALYLLDLPVARDMEGKVLTSGITNRRLESQAIVEIETYGGPSESGDSSAEEGLNDDTLKELEALGYLN